MYPQNLLHWVISAIQLGVWSCEQEGRRNTKLWQPDERKQPEEGESGGDESLSLAVLLKPICISRKLSPGLSILT